MPRLDQNRDGRSGPRFRRVFRFRYRQPRADGPFYKPEDVARAIAFLAHEDSFINGVSLPVDGGWIADASWDALRVKKR